MLDPNTLRRDFPIFESHPGIIYLDSAATALKPKSVIETMNQYYLNHSTNVGRGLYPLAEQTTELFENARATIARFIHAEAKEAIVFTANATHGLNLTALGLEHRISSEDNVVTTELEHHSNFLPWKELSKRRGAELRSARFDDDGAIDRSHLFSLIDDKTRIVAFSALSNVFGTINPVKEIITAIRRQFPDIFIIVDACQAIGHIAINIKSWDADFVVFSGHKLFGPTGIGVLTGKKGSLEALRPMNVGGGTVLDACGRETEYKPLPERLEGGTPNIAGALGLSQAMSYIEALGIESLRQHDEAMTEYALGRLEHTFGDHIRILGTREKAKRSSIISFVLADIHPHDIATLLGEANICVRAGEHCAAPLHKALDLSATTRISFSMYNTRDDIDQLVKTLKAIYLRFTL